MTMYSLAHLTVLDLPPPEVARVAADAGFDAFGLRLHPVRPGEVAPPVHGDTPMRRELLAIMKGTGVQFFDVEAFRLDRTIDFGAIEKTFEAAARLGASNALVFVDERDIDVASDLYARFCDLARQHDLDACLEFMPWLGISSLDAALSMVRTVACSNAKILLDALHFFRSLTPLDRLRELDPGLMNYVQICDAPLTAPATLDAIANEARFERLYPGEGELPVVEFLAALPDGLVVAPEVATARLAKDVSGAERAAYALATSRQVVAQMHAHRSQQGK
ncbi:Xylose isomerase-like TIM barrel domain-containing protein [Paraburkholderia sacchari]|uniref:sugar phosphate isomerase/epimerase family protein n=1 Tax=Paraburkholderia sacchari TaxID=159450 RepID=UPI0039A5AB39